MVRRPHTSEQIIHLLRQAEVGLANGKTVEIVCRELEISEQTYYRWRNEYGGMQVSQARRLREESRACAHRDPSSGVCVA